MGLTFTKLFARLFSKREMRILMVSGRRRTFLFSLLCGEEEEKKNRKTIDGAIESSPHRARSIKLPRVFLFRSPSGSSEAA